MENLESEVSLSLNPTEELTFQKKECNIEQEGQLNHVEEQMVQNFAMKIDVEKTDQILNYGMSAQKKMSDFADQVLGEVSTKDLGDTGQLLTSVATSLRKVDLSQPKGIKGFFKKRTSLLENVKSQYASIGENVDRIMAELEKRQTILSTDAEMLEQLYQQNLTYFKELNMYIMAGQMALERERKGKLFELRQKAEFTGQVADAQAFKDFDSKCNRFEKKLVDLELTKTIALQTAPQIRLIQNNDYELIEKINSTKANTIPLWKQQLVISLGIEDSLKAAQVQKCVSDLTNELLKRNAEKLNMASVETAKEAERGIVDIEVLKQTNEMLIKTFDEVSQIQREGRRKREAATLEMKKMEEQLKKKLLSSSQQIDSTNHKVYTYKKQS